MTENFMTVEEAMPIVWELANENQPDINKEDESLHEQIQKQQLALNVIADFIANVLEEGRL